MCRLMRAIASQRCTRQAALQILLEGGQPRENVVHGRVDGFAAGGGWHPTWAKSSWVHAILDGVLVIAWLFTAAVAAAWAAE